MVRIERICLLKLTHENINIVILPCGCYKLSNQSNKAVAEKNECSVKVFQEALFKVQCLTKL